MKPIAISASLVVYKANLEILKRTVFSLQEAAAFAKKYYNTSIELTIIDNSCDSETKTNLSFWVDTQKPLLPDLFLDLLFSQENLGYGRGNNLIIHQVVSDYHLVVNPDLFVEVGFFKEAIDYMQKNVDVGLLSPAVFGEDGERQFLCKRNPTLFIMFLRSFCPKWLVTFFRKTLEDFEMRDHDYSHIIDHISYPTGCCMFFRTNFLHRIQGFDPAYFLHYEDADIGRKMLQVARVVYVPSVKVVHKWARDTHHSWRMRLITVWSGLIYWHKWGGAFKSNFPINWSNSDFDKLIYRESIPQVQKILVTGANGFVGKSLCEVLRKSGLSVRAAVREIGLTNCSDNLEYVTVGQISGETDWAPALSGVDIVIHLAARVHIMYDESNDPGAEFERVNVAGTERLINAAAESGVKRIVYLSSIKVTGEVNDKHHEQTPSPQDPYAISKLKAELILQQIGQTKAIEVVIVRPPLVYGSGVKANFLNLIRWVDHGVPLPLGSIQNKRSLIYLGNLIDALILCATHPAAAGQTYMISDREQVSTPVLIRNLANALNRSSRIFPFPVSVMRILAKFFGRLAEVERLTQSLIVDCSKIQRELNWVPPYTMAEGLKSTADWYHKSLGRKKV